MVHAAFDDEIWTFHWPSNDVLAATGVASKRPANSRLVSLALCNVFMVVNGHYPGEGRRTDLNNCGQPVHQVLMDYQSRTNGGDGWLRYFAFKPSENKIYAYTYSPTRSAFEVDDSSQFVLDYNMQGTPFTVVATNGDLVSGTRTSASFTGLVPGTEYEWYVTVSDGKATTTGPVSSFTAAAPNTDLISPV